MEKLQFKVPGHPQGKGRPRFARRGKFVQSYTPEKTVSYENWIRNCYQKEHGDNKLLPPISMDIVAIFDVPKSYSAKKRAACLAGETLPTCKPDVDNIVKCVADALNGIAYVDDSSITDLTMHKKYGTQGCLLVRLTGCVDIQTALEAQNE